jgi:hypothetical protein
MESSVLPEANRAISPGRRLVGNRPRNSYLMIAVVVLRAGYLVTETLGLEVQRETGTTTYATATAQSTYMQLLLPAGKLVITSC